MMAIATTRLTMCWQGKLTGRPAPVLISEETVKCQ
jgi:hypothetical protein